MVGFLGNNAEKEHDLRVAAYGQCVPKGKDLPPKEANPGYGYSTYEGTEGPESDAPYC